jgi:serine protease Do
MGLSFAIPIDVANDVRTQLVSNGKVRRGRIGVSIQPLTGALAESLGLDRPRGALIGSVEPGGPAEKAGIKEGDIIVRVDGRAIERDAEVPSLISSIAPGKETQIEVWRDRGTRKLNVRVAEMKEEGAVVAMTDGGPAAKPSAMGLTLRSLQPEELRAAKLDRGLLVEDVTGPAEAADVRAGDIILGVNGTPVRTVEDLQAATKRSGKTVALLIRRGDGQIFIPVRTE